MRARYATEVDQTYAHHVHLPTGNSVRLEGLLKPSNPGSVVHRKVALIACDTAVTLRETLHRLEDLGIDAVQIGGRHLAMPASQIHLVLERLKEHGQFPRLVGEQLESATAASEDDAEGESDE